MAYKFRTTNRFEKSVERCKRRGLPMQELKTVIDQLVENGKVDPKYRPHKLSGDRKGIWDCHIQSDWLLLWEQNDRELTLLMVDTGTHSDLFKK